MNRQILSPLGDSTFRSEITDWAGDGIQIDRKCADMWKALNDKKYCEAADKLEEVQIHLDNLREFIERNILTTE